MKTTIMVALLFAIGNFSPDVYHMARAIQGEGAKLVCPNLDCDLPERIGQVVYNRYKSGWCDTIESCVDGGFWGAKTVLIPASWAILAAEKVLEERALTDAFYVFSIQDCESLDLDTDDALYFMQNGIWGLAFYDEHALEELHASK